MFGWGKKKDEPKQEHVHHGWKPGVQVEYISKDDGKYVNDAGRDYKIATEEDFSKFRDFADGTSEEWTLRAEKNGIFVWDRPTTDKAKSAVNCVKLFAEFKGVSPKVMYDTLHDAEYRATWDNNMIAGYNIVRLDANNDVGYYHVRLPTGVANRDFCNQRSWRNIDDKEFIIMNHSVPHERCPPTKAVRGVSIISGYLVRPHGDDGCSFTYVSQSDPKGWIPTMILNSIITSQGPNLVGKMYNASKSYAAWRDSQPPSAERNWWTGAEPWTQPQPQRTIEWFCAKTETPLEQVLGQEGADAARAASKGAPPVKVQSLHPLDVEEKKEGEEAVEEKEKEVGTD